MGLFTNSKSWGAQMKAAKGVKTGKEAKAETDKKNNPSQFKRAKAKGRVKW